MGSIPTVDDPLRRGSEHRDEDYERTVQKLLEHQFNDWPNEAGFEGLTEVQGPVDLLVKGSIPAWAAGTLYRTGPGEYNVEDTVLGTFRTTHWFDGFGHSHKFEIIPSGHGSDDSVRVEYTSRRQTQELVEAIRKNGRRPDITFGQRQDPCVGMFSKLMSFWRLASPTLSPDLDNISVTVQGSVPGLPPTTKQPVESGHRSGTKTGWLGSDIAILKAFNEDTMEATMCVPQTHLHPLLKGPLSCAHPQRDPETGDYFNFNLELGRISTYRIFRSNASTGTTDILATISQSDAKPAYIHSFFLSQSYVIFCIPSTHIGGKGLKIPWTRNIVDAIEPFDQNKLCKWFIIDRKGNKGVVASFNTPAGFYFHSVNSFEEVDVSTGVANVFCDLIEYPNIDIIRAYELNVLLSNNDTSKTFWSSEGKVRNSLARLVRYKFSLSDGGARKGARKHQPSAFQKAEKIIEIKAPHAGELPTINPNFVARKYRYVYSLPNRGFSTLADSIVKTDIESQETLFWDNPKGHTPGEAIFIPRPQTNENEDMAEDDGVLLSIVLDGHNKSSYLVCIDAKTMKELGKAECEWAVAFGFHGLHAPA